MSRPKPCLRRRRRRNGEDGQALVEFALVLPILLLLLLGIAQFGMLFYTYIDLTSATRDGARRIAVARTTNAGTADARKVVADDTTVVDDSQTTITVTPDAPWTANQSVTVKVTYPYKLDIMGLVVWNGPMTAESIARIE